METSKSEWSDFERTWTTLVVDSINTVRVAAGVTVKDLAARLRVLGWPVSDATLSGMLSGGKRGSISIAELSAFGRALNITPLFFVMGLPGNAALPEGKLWGAEAPLVGNFADWLAGRDLQEQFPEGEKDDKLRRLGSETASRANEVLMMVYQHKHLLEIISWQVAQLVASEDFDDDVIQDALPKSVYSQEYLWEAAQDLRALRTEQTLFTEPWAFPLPELPPELQFIDAPDAIIQTQLPINALRGLATEPLIVRARQSIEDLIDNQRKVRPAQKHSGFSPTK